MHKSEWNKPAATQRKTLWTKLYLSFIITKILVVISPKYQHFQNLWHFLCESKDMSGESFFGWFCWFLTFPWIQFPWYFGATIKKFGWHPVIILALIQSQRFPVGSFTSKFCCFACYNSSLATLQVRIDVYIPLSGVI